MIQLISKLLKSNQDFDNFLNLVRVRVKKYHATARNGDARSSKMIRILDALYGASSNVPSGSVDGLIISPTMMGIVTVANVDAMEATKNLGRVMAGISLHHFLVGSPITSVTRFRK